MKGTDASWKDDQETPALFADYSDDESEQKSRRKNKNATYKPGIATNTVPLNYFLYKAAEDIFLREIASSQILGKSDR